MHRISFLFPGLGRASQPGENVHRCHSTPGSLLQGQFHAAFYTQFARDSCWNSCSFSVQFIATRKLQTQNSGFQPRETLPSVPGGA